jgi:hypothetical protein
MNISYRNHYLPQFYLKSFTDDKGIFWVYYKNQDQPKRQTPINTGIEKNMYTIKKRNGIVDDSLEKRVFAPIESSVSPIINHLIHSKKYSLNKDDKSYLALFIAFMATRVPRSIKAVKEIELN